MVPSEEYVQRRNERVTSVAHYEKIHLRLGNVRLLLAVVALFMAWASFRAHSLSPWWLVAPVVALVALALAVFALAVLALAVLALAVLAVAVLALAVLAVVVFSLAVAVVSLTLEAAAERQSCRPPAAVA